MAAYTWPGGLPQNIRRDFQVSRGLNILSTTMDTGPAKRRRRGAAVETIKVGYYMTASEIAILENFIQNTIKGVARFDYNHPVTGTSIEVRFVPQSDGQLYTVSFSTPTQWAVDMTLEVVP